MKSAEWPARTAWCSRFLVSMALPSLGGDEDDILALRDEVEREDPVDGWPVQLLRPGPFEIREGFEAAESRRLERPFEPSASARIEFGLHEGLEQQGRAPARPRRSGNQIVEGLGGLREA